MGETDSGALVFQRPVIANPTSAVITSVNTGAVRTVEWKGQRVTTGIWKSPVNGRVPVVRHHLEGDVQANPQVHGGPRKAVYAYPRTHYDFWREDLGGLDLQWGAFGENLTIDGLREDQVRVGEQWEAGTAVVEVTQARSPCFKLNIRFGREDMVRRFWYAARPGFYLAVVREGTVGAGDPFRRIRESPGAPTIEEEFLHRRGDHPPE